MVPWKEYSPELLTDLYEITMAASYLKEGMSGEATFSLFIRDYPSARSYFVSAGLEHILQLIPEMRFSESSIDYLASLKKFQPEILDYLGRFRFTGSIRAIPEGRIFFAQEPVLEVTGPIIEAQLLETLIINGMQLEILVASKAARCMHAAKGRPLMDFGLRRTHGAEAGVRAARATYITGFSGTSNLLAGKLYGIPVFGTMAHSYVTSFNREIDSFHAFARAFPDNTVLLIDTYDTIQGARKAIEVARLLREEGKKLRAVRLDSGDLVRLSREVRGMLEDAGFPEVKVLASGNLDEYRLQELIEAGAEVDMFAVGTRVGVSADAPYFDIAYKLVEYDGRPLLKLSSGKKTWVGKKQIYRHYGADGRMSEDFLCLLDEEHAGGEPIMVPVMERGEVLRPLESLDTIRRRFSEDWSALPERYKDLEAREKYPVKIGPSLEELERTVAERIIRDEIGGVL